MAAPDLNDPFGGASPPLTFHAFLGEFVSCIPAI